MGRRSPLHTRSTLSRITLFSLVATIALQVGVLGVPAAAATGDLIADVIVPEPHPRNISPSVAFDGRYLYYVEYEGSTLYRIDMPPAGGQTTASGQVAIPITGAGALGIMTLSYDAGRDAFWAVSGDSLAIYLLQKSGAASLVFRIDPDNDRPGWNPNRQWANEIKIAYDGADDTIWYSPDEMPRIYHYQTVPDAQGTAAPAATPYIDVDVAPNDMEAQCGYSLASGVAAGGDHLFVSVAGCPYYFEYTKTGARIAAHAFPPELADSINTTPMDLECDNLTYGVSVLWMRDGWDGHIRALQQPAANACRYGGGARTPPGVSGYIEVTTAATPASGVSFQLDVIARDELGQIDTNYAGTLHFTSSDTSSGVVLPPDSTLANGRGTFTATLATTGPQTITATDTVTSSITGQLAVNVRAIASRLVLSTTATPTAGSPFSFSVTAQDGSGNVDTGYAGTVRFTSSDTSGATLPADATLNNGQGNFSATLTRAGPQTITATDTATSSISGTLSVTLRAGPAASLSLGAPSSVTAGQAFQATVTLKDAYGNPAGGTVRFSSSDSAPGVVLPPDSQVNNGQGVFSATLVRAGSQTLTARDTANAEVTATVGIGVRAGPTANLSVAAPAQSTAGQAFQVTVNLKDAYGNVASGTVHFSSTDTSPAAILPPDSQVNNGQGTFSATLVRAGAQTVTARDTATGASGSATISVRAGPAASLTVTAASQPVAGQAFPVTVALKDTYGNLTSGTVHFTSSDTAPGVVLPPDSQVNNGQGTFSATLVRAGSQTITARDTATGVNGTATVTVRAGAAASLSLAAPSQATSGQAFQVIVTLKDAYGNQATGYVGRVHFTSTDSLASLPSDYTFTGGDGGMHTFSVTLTTPTTPLSPHTITVRDTANASLTATSKPISVSVAQAAPGP